MKKNIIIIITLFCHVLFFRILFASAEIKDHPIIESVIRSTLIDYSEQKNFLYEMPHYNIQDNKIKYLKLRGLYLRYEYLIEYKDVLKKEGVYSPLEIIEHYRDLALEKKGILLWERNKRLSFNVSKSEGGTVWCQVFAEKGHYILDIIEEKGQSALIGSAGFNLERFTILFDFDKYNLKQGAIKKLFELLLFLRQKSDFVLEIDGHTDNHGTKAYNVDLSIKRAISVKSFLLQHGIKPFRLFIKGFDYSRPVAVNSTDSGRARNRRVVFKQK